MLTNHLKQNGIGVLKSGFVMFLMISVLAVVSFFSGELFGTFRNLVEVWPTELTALCGIGNIFAKHGIRYARTVKSTNSFALPEKPLLLDPTCHHGDPKVFDLLEEFINAEPTDGDLLFYLWGHSYEFNRNEDFNNWDHLEKICKKISGRNDIVYCTNMEFFNR